jgi:CrcB protein
MSKVIAVALGGALGSVGRYLIALLVGRISKYDFPYETLAANLVGCLLIGLFWGYFERVQVSNEFRLFLFTGILGGFTTFSTFARESVQYLKSGEPLHAVTYLLASNVFGLTLVAVGFMISIRFLHSERLF